MLCTLWNVFEVAHHVGVCVFHFEYVPQPPFAVCRISFFSYWPAYFLAMYVFYLYLFVCVLMRTLY